MSRGKFIVLEGGEDSGKSRCIQYIRQHQDLFGQELIFTEEPGGTPIAHQIREILMDPHLRVDHAVAEILLHYAARAIHLQHKIIPVLELGKTVISDRFSGSTYAYQIYGRDRTDLLDWVSEIDRVVVGSFQPDLVIYLDVDPAIGLKRMEGRGETMTAYDCEELSFHERVRAGYLSLCELHADTWVTVDARVPFEQECQQVKSSLGSLWGSSCH